MTRLEIILETVNELLEGSKRKWSKEKRREHARGTKEAAYGTHDREHARLHTYLMRQEDDLGARGHPVNMKRNDARRKLKIKQGMIADLKQLGDTSIPGSTNSLKDAIKAVYRYHRILDTF
jgi:hypothetical protein